MSRTDWFDAKTNELMFVKYVEQMESWQDAIADGVIEESEIQQQAERLVELLKALEPKYSEMEERSTGMHRYGFTRKFMKSLLVIKYIEYFTDCCFI